MFGVISSRSHWAPPTLETWPCIPSWKEKTQTGQFLWGNVLEGTLETLTGYHSDFLSLYESVPALVSLFLLCLYINSSVHHCVQSVLCIFPTRKCLHLTPFPRKKQITLIICVVPVMYKATLCEHLSPRPGEHTSGLQVCSPSSAHLELYRRRILPFCTQTFPSWFVCKCIHYCHWNIIQPNTIAVNN